MKNFKQIQLYTVLIQGTRTILSAFANLSYFQKSMYSAGIKIFNSLVCKVHSHMNEKAQCKVEDA
jgi:hypothetical protein